MSFADKQVLRHLVEFYVYDYSDYMGWDVDEHGVFGYRYLDHYWTEPDRHPFFIRVDGRLAGFALVRAELRTTWPSSSSCASTDEGRRDRRRTHGVRALPGHLGGTPDEGERRGDDLLALGDFRPLRRGSSRRPSGAVVHNRRNFVTLEQV